MVIFLNVENFVCTPVSNRGVQPTTKPYRTLCCDWVSCTFPLETLLCDVLNALKLDLSLFSMQDYAFYRYSGCYLYNGIRILVGHEQSAFMLDFSGAGCRFYESLETGHSWIDVFNIFFDYGGSFTRIDLALDVFNGNSFTIATMYKKACKGHTKGRFRSFDYYVKHRFEDGRILGETLYFGSAASLIRFRFYNKLDERVSKNIEVLENIDSWIRFEMCLRKEHANFFVYLLLMDKRDIVDLYFGIVRRYLLFLVPNSDSNKWRWKICPWWEKFLNSAQEVRLVKKVDEPTVFSKQRWLSDSVSRTFAFMYLLEEEHGFPNPLNSKNLTAFEKLFENHEKEYEIYNQYRISLGFEEISKSDFLRFVGNRIFEIKNERKKIINQSE